MRRSNQFGFDAHPLSSLAPNVSCGSNPDFLLGGRTSASAECRHWSEHLRQVRAIRKRGELPLLLCMLADCDTFASTMTAIVPPTLH